MKFSLSKFTSIKWYFNILFIVILSQNCNLDSSEKITVKKWDTLTLDFVGDEVDEKD